jgi:hypothetical protein
MHRLETMSLHADEIRVLWLYYTEITFRWLPFTKI